MRSVALLLPLLACACGGEGAVVVVDGASYFSSDVAAEGDRARLVRQASLAAHARRLGLDESDAMKARLRKAERDTLAAAALEHVLAEATTEEKLREAYEQKKQALARRRVHVAHVVLPANVDADAVLVRAATADFASIAREVSTDAPSAARGGELPPLDEGTVDASFFDGAWKLKAGEVGYVQSAHGRHVVKALADPITVEPTFEEARSQLTSELARQATAELHQHIEVKEP